MCVLAILAGSVAAVLALPAVASAEEPSPPGAPPASPSAPPSRQADDEALRKRLEEEIARELGGPASPPAGPAAAPAPATTATPPAAGQGPTGGNPYARLLLLPDLSAVGRFAIAHDSYDVETLSPRDGPFGPEGRPQPLFEELELGLQSVVDPYLRADVFVAFGPDGADVEEAYATTLSLPAGLQVRAGKLFSPLGRQNQQHPHVWEFVDPPLARGRLVADEALGGPGVDVAWLAPLPWFAELRLAGQATAPAEEDAEELTAVARLLQYFPLGEATALGVGLSAARRREGAGASRDLGAIDLHLRWRPLRQRSYLALQGELFAREFRGVEGGAETAGHGGSDAGGYAQLYWRAGTHAALGLRYDDAPAAAALGEGRERRWGALAAWLPSEFQRVRLQLSYDRRPGGAGGLEAVLGLEIAIGAHGAHPF